MIKLSWVDYIVQKKKINSTGFRAETDVCLPKLEFTNGLLFCKLYHRLCESPFPPLSTVPTGNIIIVIFIRDYILNIRV
jgi:hypothetical protein